MASLSVRWFADGIDEAERMTIRLYQRLPDPDSRMVEQGKYYMYRSDLKYDSELKI